jgi:hypothetical protein
MNARSGEKIGWIGGWTGGFMWIGVFTIIWFFQGKTVEALAGVGLICIAGFVLFAAAPWRWPDTPYWKLLLPLYGILALSVAWVLLSFQHPRDAGVSLWSLFLLMPALLPLASSGRRRWADGETGNERAQR